MEKTDLKPCPFCGGEAEMHMDEFPTKYTKCEKCVPQGARIVRQAATKSGTLFEYREKCYSPRCTVKGCLGRSYKKFTTEAEAAEAWNRRATNEADADALFKFLKGQREKETGAYSKGRNNGINIAIGAIRNEQICPTVDAVPVVRCKDCKQWRRNIGFTDNPNGHCFYHDIDANGFDFCSYGERRNDNA